MKTFSSLDITTEEETSEKETLVQDKLNQELAETTNHCRICY